MDTQRQCVVKIKIYYKVIINLLYSFKFIIYFFHTKNRNITILYKHIIRIYKINFY